MVDVSDVDNLHQLTKLLQESPTAAGRVLEVGGVVPKLVELQDCESIEVEEQARVCLSLLGYAPPYSGRGLRILSIDGGGTRGLIPITILKHIETICGQPVHKLFDFVCGTSTGSVLAALLCLEKFTAEKCKETYHDFSTEVFKMNNLLGISQFFLNHAFYDARLLEKVLRKYNHTNFLMHEISKWRGVPRMCFVSTVANQPSVEPYLFCNYQHHPDRHEAAAHYQRTSKVQCWEAIMASTAAPGFFEEVKLNRNLFLDGGILTNNPCGVAIHESRLLWGKDTPIQTIISLGTGLYRKNERQTTARDKITSTSLKEKIIKVVAGATDTETVHTILKDVYDPSVYFRFQPDLSEDITIDESKPEKLALLCQDAEDFVLSHRHMLENAASSLMAEKKPAQKMQVWLNYNMNKLFLLNRTRSFRRQTSVS